MWFRNIFKGKTNPRKTPHRIGSNVDDRENNRAGGQAIALSSQMIRVLDRLQLNSGPLSPAMPAGLRSSVARRPAYEFREHRQYTPGDDVRYVDWKASARQEHVFIKQGDDHKGTAVYVLIDCSASMGWGEPTKSTAALALAHALGYLALAHNDRLVLMPITGENSTLPHSGSEYSKSDNVTAGNHARKTLHPLGPLWGKGQAPMLESYLRAMRFEGQIDLEVALGSLHRRNLSRGGLVFVLSDLFGAVDLAAGLEKLPSPAWQVVFCHLLHPAELDPHLNGPLEMQDMETGRKKRYTIDAGALATYRQRLDAWQEKLAGSCREKRAIYCMLSTGASLEDEIIPRLWREHVVVPRR